MAITRYLVLGHHLHQLLQLLNGARSHRPDALLPFVGKPGELGQQTFCDLFADQHHTTFAETV